MNVLPLNEKATLLRSYHHGDSVLVLPNAWDAGSAAVIARAGAAAIATTSAGVAWSLGYPDGQRLSRDEMVQAVGRIAAVVDVPVTADVEGGYGPSPHDVELTVAAVVGAGAVGINLEDSRDSDYSLFEHQAQALRIQAAREAAVAAGVPDLVINARTDVFLFRVGDPADRPDDVLARAEVYAAAGADCLFVPGLLDLVTLKSIADAAPLPISAMGIPGGPSVADLGAAGVRRVSVGSAVTQAAYSVTLRAATELLAEGTCGSREGLLGVRELNSLFPDSRS